MSSKKVSANFSQYIFNEALEKQSELLELKDESTKIKGIIVALHGHQHGSKTSGAWETLRIMAPHIVQAGYVALAPSVLGYGKTRGERDFSGPKSVNRLLDTLQCWKNENGYNGSFIIIGASRGGTLAVLTSIIEPHMFSHVVSAPGVYDLASHYAAMNPDSIKRKNIEAEAGVSPEELAKRSAIEQVEKIKKPTLLIHGEQDEEIDVDQAVKFGKQLKEYHKEHRAVLLPGKGHNILSKKLFTDEIIPFIQS